MYTCVQGAITAKSVNHWQLYITLGQHARMQQLFWQDYKFF